jgi:hypothetical protein
MEQRMPLARYFFYVGGVLLALLFILDAYLPELPVAGRENIHLPVIRIHSDRKWPERIVYDTSLPTIVPAPVASKEAEIYIPATVADVSVKVREREAFAQLQSSDAKQLQLTDRKKRELKLQHERKIAKRRVVPPTVLAARQPKFGWFGNSVWNGNSIW